MSHVIADVIDAYPPPKKYRKPKTKSTSRELQSLSALLQERQVLYEQSQLSQAINRQLQATLKNAATPITRILSLGLGSFFVIKGQSRRLKQLTILLGIRDALRQGFGMSIEVYAQDPTFTRADETFLINLNVRILRTPSGSELGEAASVISSSTLVYSPFLTLEAYEQLLVNSATVVQYLIGDDFNALLSKWPRHTAERAQVESVMKSGLAEHQRRAVAGEGFWTEGDGTFPFAMYQRLGGKVGRKLKAKI
ncbi:hypothetical protein EJ02DRAFT_64232 [Clathrospora elynae]|uniref:SRR1-like domain-containing protein n=1 Tax=Clathrospora elynae TaxID=706981 RepID=A0A6A5SF67_9PLEO|nr:hypothetical protein EJ02DRAFT_64232 [Clathrospora elynae]